MSNQFKVQVQVDIQYDSWNWSGEPCGDASAADLQLSTTELAFVRKLCYCADYMAITMPVMLNLGETDSGRESMYIAQLYVNTALLERVAREMDKTITSVKRLRAKCCEKGAIAFVCYDKPKPPYTGSYYTINPCIWYNKSARRQRNTIMYYSLIKCGRKAPLSYKEVWLYATRILPTLKEKYGKQCTTHRTLTLTANKIEPTNTVSSTEASASVPSNSERSSASAPTTILPQWYDSVNTPAVIPKEVLDQLYAAYYNNAPEYNRLLSQYGLTERDAYNQLTNLHPELDF